MSTTHPHIIRRANERGHSNHGWLDSHHTFSFADYYDPDWMGFRSLRVINDDRVAARGGFPTHPHRDMEIFSYVLSGTLAHKDSLGNQRELLPGQIQLMRAGSGIHHSEGNPSTTEEVHFLQIWITPATRALAPAYTEWTPPPDQTPGAKTLVISPDGREGSAQIAQDATVHILKTSAATPITHTLAPGRGLWLHLIQGSAQAFGDTLHPGDAAATETAGEITITPGPNGLEALLFDLA